MISHQITMLDRDPPHEQMLDKYSFCIFRKLSISQNFFCKHSIIRKLKHPHLVSIYCYWMEQDMLINSFKFKKSLEKNVTSYQILFSKNHN